MILGVMGTTIVVASGITGVNLVYNDEMTITLDCGNFQLLVLM